MSSSRRYGLSLLFCRMSFSLTVVTLSLTLLPSVLPFLPDCQLCQRQVDRRIDAAGVPGHPGEHGAEQPQPLPAGQTGSHHGAAHRSPPGVSN